MDRILAAVLAAGKPGGPAYLHYVKTATWEPQLRRDIRAFVESLGGEVDAQEARTRGIDLLTQLNNKCKFRYAEAKIPGVYDAVALVINARGWFKKSPPEVLTCSDTEAAAIAETVVAIMRVIAQTTATLPYSLVTKFLHYSFPSTFVVYDNRTAASVLAWVKNVYGAGTGPNSSRQQYMAETLASTDATSYIGLVRFYRMFWDGVTAADEVTAMSASTEEIVAAVQALPDAADFSITAVDIIEKTLNTANGDRKALHLSSV